MNETLNKDDLIENFKEITGITDSQCVNDILIQFHWDVFAAINSVIEVPSSETKNSIKKPNEPSPSTEESCSNTVKINLTLQNNPLMFDQFELPDSVTVYDLKKMFFNSNSAKLVEIASSFNGAIDVTENGIINALELTGINGNENPMNNQATLHSLNLPPTNDVLVTLECPIHSRTTAAIDNPAIDDPEITLRIKLVKSTQSKFGSSSFETSFSSNEQHHQGAFDSEQLLCVRSSMNLNEVRRRAQTSTNIPVSSQHWFLPSQSTSTGRLSELVKDLNRAHYQQATGKKTLTMYQLPPHEISTVGLNSGKFTASLHHGQSVTTGFIRGTHSTKWTSSCHSSKGRFQSTNTNTSGINNYNSSSRIPRNQRNTTPIESLTMEDADSSYFGVDDDDDDIQMIADEQLNPERLPLIPLELIDTPTEAITNFSSVFIQRYCADGAAVAPPFNICSLQEAFDASFKTVRLEERKPLFIYLHNDNSVAVHIFCQRILCSEEVEQFFSATENTIWPWDITQEAAKEKLLQWLEPRLQWIATEIRHKPTDHFPMLIMVGKIAGSLEVLTMLTGNGITSTPYTSSLNSFEENPSFPSLDVALGPSASGWSPRDPPKSRTLVAAEVTTELWQKLSMLDERLAPELQAERDRVEREYMRAEQDQAYEDSLLQDKLKLEAKVRTRQEQERMATEALLEAEKEKNQAANRRTNACRALPSEPAEGSPGTTTLRFRLPSGFDGPPAFETGQASPLVLIVRGMLVRRFRATECLRDLKNYMESLGFDTDNYKLLTTYPRTDLTSRTDDQVTLTDLKLVPQETLVLEQR